MSSAWTESLIEIATTMWRSGNYSAADIAAALPGAFSRNSVISKMNRLGIAQPLRTQTRAKVTAKKEPKKSSEKVMKARKEEVVIYYRPPPSESDRVIDTSGPRKFPQARTLFDLRIGDCRWPTWSHLARPPALEALYCGAPVYAGRQSRSYCVDCYGLAYAPPRYA